MCRNRDWDRDENEDEDENENGEPGTGRSGYSIAGVIAGGSLPTYRIASSL